MSAEAVIVTGAGGGIGKALVEVFEAKGVHAIGLARRSVDGLIGCDLAELGRTGALPADVRAAIDERLEGRRLRALINNAATQHLGKTAEIGWDRWQETLAVNLSAPFALVRIFLDRLQADGGCVLNIGSVHAQATKPEFAAYGTSKAALHGLTRALAVDLGPRVRVCGLAPAAIDTAMLRAGFEGNPEGFSALEAVHPVGRIGSPREVAEAAIWMTGPDAGFLAGTNVYLDGGVLSRLHDPA